MIANDQELQCTRERIEFFYKTVAQMRERCRTPEEYRLYANAYLNEIEQMNAEVLNYLKRHPTESASIEAA